jgi:predicted Zn-dependent protease
VYVYASDVAARALLALLAVLVLAWVGVLLRNHELGEDALARSFFAAQLGEEQRQRDLEDLEDAELLDPSSSWDVTTANYLLLSGDVPGAARAAERLVRDEPDNVSAWNVLQRATADSDPSRSAEAAAEIRRLNPRG